MIRNESETVTEDMDLAFINWNTGAPLTNEAWSGGPYVLVENYEPTVCKVVDPAEFAEIADTNTLTPETVTIDGVTYIRTS